MPFLLGVLHTMMSSGLVDMVSRSGGLAR
jgi:hypothetical protein